MISMLCSDKEVYFNVTLHEHNCQKYIKGSYAIWSFVWAPGFVLLLVRFTLKIIEKNYYFTLYSYHIKKAELFPTFVDWQCGLDNIL